MRPAGVDKGTAVRWLCERFGVPCHQVAAVGDSDVDVGMVTTSAFDKSTSKKLAFIIVALSAKPKSLILAIDCS